MSKIKVVIYMLAIVFFLTACGSKNSKVLIIPTDGQKLSYSITGLGNNTDLIINGETFPLFRCNSFKMCTTINLKWETISTNSQEYAEVEYDGWGKPIGITFYHSQ